MSRPCVLTSPFPPHFGGGNMPSKRPRAQIGLRCTGVKMELAAFTLTKGEAARADEEWVHRKNDVERRVLPGRVGVLPAGGFRNSRTRRFGFRRLAANGQPESRNQGLG
ncbi:hypothetical protein TraAM80_00074 [Trypanosoma rangeli]|uniref:Uncharacterized protein n=1 Tax=Trypanosoma rangeli TaxID=5698 RepID=A0A422P5C5_TRYRA|nr:uncharacterized protein TraAM80_00074 [Trypanosoma rangeli]RNF12916.1 hypothetical protein TraAM80_00074 [Trypanosoma rangeli]|eukprot:RNF12916.1 hypothetical protein TraAM80_00074 [Trypanosoma rangeli]